MKATLLYSLGMAAVLAIAAAPARAQETADEKIARLQTELDDAKKAKVAELEAEIARIRGDDEAAPKALAVRAVAPVPPPPPAAMIPRPKGETASERVERTKANLQIAITGLTQSAAPLGFRDGAPAETGAAQAAQVTQATNDAADAKAEDQLEAQASKDFMGLGLGVGLSFTFGLGGDRVTGATLDPNGIVRISDKDNAVARVMLEAHHLFGFGSAETAEDGTKKYRRGWGPFVAIQPGDGEVIDAIGGGLMFGFRPDIKSSKSFNLGVGVVVDPNTQRLGDGIVANKPLPAGETEIRFKKTANYGILLLTSFAF